MVKKKKKKKKKVCFIYKDITECLFLPSPAESHMGSTHLFCIYYCIIVKCQHDRMPEVPVTEGKLPPPPSLTITS